MGLGSKKQEICPVSMATKDVMADHVSIATCRVLPETSTRTKVEKSNLP